MQAEDRPIHFSTELMHPPSPPAVPVLQKLYYELSQTRGVGYDSTNFSPPGPPRFYSKRGPKTQSIALFLPDRLVLLEEWVDMPFAQFMTKVEAVAAQAMPALGIESFNVQTATIRTTFGLTHFDDARVFLLDHICRQDGELGAYFGRPIGVGGLRFVLPETPDVPGTLHVIIESYRHSANEVFVEVKGVFANQHVTREGLETLRNTFLQVRRFISDHIFPYLNQYDEPREGVGS
jgi:hypothetical protein